MEKNYDLKPVLFDEANSTLSGGPLTDEVKALSLSDAVRDLPCYKDEHQIVAKWHLAGFWERVRFLLRGEVYIITLGTSQPPYRVTIDSPIETEI
jgi:hypothetical protein